MTASFKKMHLLKRLKQKIQRVLISYKKYECPFCNNSSKGLLPIGIDLPVLKKKKVVGGGRRFAGCKICGSNDRERLIYIYLKERLGIFSSDKKKSILHIAPEEQISKAILKFGFHEYVCGDLFAEGYTYPAHVQNMNIVSIPYDDNSFDLVICNHVLEHIEDDRKAMREIYRVLKTDGQAILQVPISKNSEKTLEDFSIINPTQREIVYGQSDHIRIYGQDYVQRLQENGFRVKKLNIVKEYNRYGLNPNEDLFICKK